MNTEIIFRLLDSVAASELERRSEGRGEVGAGVVAVNIGGKPYRIVVTEMPKSEEQLRQEGHKVGMPVEVLSPMIEREKKK